jgi:hypothetical protein
MQTGKVTFLSPDYFALARAHTDLASAFALGPAVIVVIDGAAIEVVLSSEQNESTAVSQEDTPEPIVIKPIATPDLEESPMPDPDTASGSHLPCWSGLLPLLPLSVILIKVRRRGSS